MKICEEEADEACYWLELIREAGYLPNERLDDIYKEAKELSAILTAACKTTRQGNS